MLKLRYLKSHLLRDYDDILRRYPSHKRRVAVSDTIPCNSGAAARPSHQTRNNSHHDASLLHLCKGVMRLYLIKAPLVTSLVTFSGSIGESECSSN